MTIEELVARPHKVRIAIEAWKAAATTCTNDGGSTNLNRVIIPGLWARHQPNLPGYVRKKSLYRRQGTHLRKCSRELAPAPRSGRDSCRSRGPAHSAVPAATRERLTRLAMPNSNTTKVRPFRRSIVSSRVLSPYHRGSIRLRVLSLIK